MSREKNIKLVQMVSNNCDRPVGSVWKKPQCQR